jgi:hypothetical protein
MIDFFAKNPMMESPVCVRMYCHVAGSTCWGTVLGSRDKPTVSDVSNLGDVNSGWQSDQVGQTHDALSL